MLNILIEAMENAIREVRQWPEKTVQIFHHNDADGLCSGAILTRAFERQGFEVRRFCLEKPYPVVLKKIYAQEGRIFIFADFAPSARLINWCPRHMPYTGILPMSPAASSTCG